VLRATVIWDESPNQPTALPTYGNIMSKTTQDGTVGQPLMTDIRYGRMERYHILAEKIFLASPKVLDKDSAKAAEIVKSYEIEIDLTGLKTVYASNSTPMTVTDISRGGLYIYFRAYVNSGNESEWYLPNINWCRLRYSDA